MEVGSLGGTPEISENKGFLKKVAEFTSRHRFQLVAMLKDLDFFLWGLKLFSLYSLAARPISCQSKVDVINNFATVSSHNFHGVWIMMYSSWIVVE